MLQTPQLDAAHLSTSITFSVMKCLKTAESNVMEPLSRIVSQSSFFSNDIIITLVLSWLDARSLLRLDYSVTGDNDTWLSVRNEECWLRCLRNTSGIGALSELEYDHRWIKWLIKRGVMTSSIQISEHFQREIVDSTFDGINSSLLRAVDLSYCFNITDSGIRIITTGCPQIKSIKLSGCSQLTDAALHLIGGRFSGLLSIDLDRCKEISDEGISSLSEGCRLLKSINFELCWRLTDDSLIAVGQRCHELTSINVTSCKKITDKGIKALASGCCNIRSVKCTRCVDLTDDALVALGTGCPLLTSIDCRYSELISDIGLCSLAACCPHLESINIESTPEGNHSITDSALVLLGQRCNMLKSVNFTYIEGITDSGIKSLTEGCPHLESINLTDSWELTDAAIRSVGLNCPKLLEICCDGDDYKVTAFTAGCSLLKSIKFTSCHDISDIALISIGQNCRDLRSIDLNHGTTITDSGIEALAHGCVKLEYIDLEACTALTDNALTSLGKHCHALTHVNVSSINLTDTGISDLASGCPHLKSLFLHGCESLTETSFSIIGRQCLELSSLGVKINVNDAGLIALTLRHSPFQYNQSNVWLMLPELGQEYYGLTVIDMRGNKNVTDAGITALAESCPYLKDVDFASCPDVTDSSMIALGQHCRGLTKANVDYNRNITDHGIVSLCKGCSDLQRLCVSYCKVCIETTLVEVAIHCRGLIEISLGGSESVNDIGITALVRGCSRLELIDIMYCPLVTSGGTRMLQQCNAPLCIKIFPNPST